MADAPQSGSPALSRGKPWGLLGGAQAALLLLAFYRGFRAPNLWSLNYYQVSWADGFLRRGLLGSLLRPLACARFDPQFIWTIQFAVLACAIASLLWLGRRGTAGLCLCLYLATDAGTFLFHEVGYPEQLILPLTLLACRLLVRRRALAAGLILALAALVHEMAVFTALPVLLVLWWRMPEPRRPSLWFLTAPLFLVLVVLVLGSTPLADATLQRYADSAAACGHPLGRPNFLGYYQETFAQEFRLYYHASELLGVVLPLLATLGLWILSGAALPGAEMKERWALLLACVCPLLLGFIGTDVNRWVFLALTQVLVLLGTADLAGAPARRGPSTARRLLLALPLLAVVLFTHIRLFDGFVPRSVDLDGVLGFGSTVVEQLSVLPKQ
ncbi:MAG TPA: hypothetical protein VK914_12565 [bacterium]|jgi:hypothetical protein|nr:hypothetical protein [bacterium]